MADRVSSVHGWQAVAVVKCVIGCWAGELGCAMPNCVLQVLQSLSGYKLDFWIAQIDQNDVSCTQILRTDKDMHD